MKTFTVRFPGNTGYDETEHARLIARHFGCDHIELDGEEVEIDLIRMLARQFDEPIIDSSMIPTYLLSRVVSGYCKVALGGDGGDELFGGYEHYNRLLWLKEHIGWIPRSLRGVIGGVGMKYRPIGSTGQNWIRALGVDFERDMPLIACYFDAIEREQMLSGRGKSIGSAEFIRNGRIPNNNVFLERAILTDFQNYLPENILVKVDRASMLCSLEVRAPMLDRQLIEFSFSEIPSELKATSRSRKVLLKKLAERLLPSGFDKMRKQGFVLPLAVLLRRPKWRNFIREILMDNRIDLFRKDYLSNLINGQDQGLNNSERLFGLLIFLLWADEYNVSV